MDWALDTFVTKGINANLRRNESQLLLAARSIDFQLSIFENLRVGSLTSPFIWVIAFPQLGLIPSTFIRRTIMLGLSCPY